MRLFDILKLAAIPSGGFGVVVVEASKSRIEPVRPARAGTAVQYARGGAKPVIGVFRAQRDGHRVANPVRGKQQLVFNGLFGNTERLQPAIAHFARAMTVQAIVDKEPRAALQSDEI